MAQAHAQQAKQAEPELDLNHLAQLIRTGRAAPELMESWLASTWRDPARFRRALYRIAATRGEAIKSRPELGLDLYADCIASHLGHQRAALVLDGREISYETLHARSGALASIWDKAGAKAGASIALLLPMGLDYAVVLLAALRLGLCITPIPPLGATYARNRLLLAAADHVVTSDRLAHMLPPDSAPPLPLSAAGADATRAASHAYAPTDSVLRLLSPFGPTDTLTALGALSLHESLLRDGLLVLSLTAADRVAAPGWDVLQLQPLMLLTTWLAGATWVECSAADFVAKAPNISVLAVDTRLRELIRERGPDSCRGVKSWFRSLNARFDHEKWRTFGELLAERDIPSFSLLFNAASSGAQLFSPRTLRDHSQRVWPAPGREFIISQVGASLLPALDATGVYTPLRDEEADASLLRLVLAKLDHGWTSGGSIDIGPEARTLPASEIAACAGRDPRVGAASLLVLAGRWPNGAHVLLLVFVHDPAAVSSELASDLRALIDDRFTTVRPAFQKLSARLRVVSLAFRIPAQPPVSIASPVIASLRPPTHGRAQEELQVDARLGRAEVGVSHQFFALIQKLDAFSKLVKRATCHAPRSSPTTSCAPSTRSIRASICCGRDAFRKAPPAQNPACGFPAPGSHLRVYGQTKRSLGQGCTIRGLGRVKRRSKRACCSRDHRARWLRRCRLRCHSSRTW